MDQKMAQKAEQNAETTAITVSNICEENSIPFPMLERDTVGVRKWHFADDSRQIRHSNESFKSWNLPEVSEKGNTKKSNKSVFTSRFVWSDMSLREAVEYLIDSEQFSDAVNELIEARGYDKEIAQVIMSYNLYIVAKGWIAERQVADKFDNLSKLWETNDVSGQDFQMGDMFIQLKSWTHGLHAVEFVGNAELLYYGWIDGDIILSFDYTDITSEMMEKAYVNFDDLREYEWVEAQNF